MFDFRDLTVGYCTNVHAGTSATDITDNLRQFAGPIRQRLRSDSIGVGLWIADSAAADLSTDVSGLAETLTAERLTPFTVNAFPIDDFHDAVVKRSVYQPPWWDHRRLDYTRRVASILAELIRCDARSSVGGASTHRPMLGSVSTLPIGWPADDTAERAKHLRLAGENLRILADDLRRLESTTGVRVTVAIEPEPGCLLQNSGQTTEFFAAELPETHHRRHLSICHDVCHSSVVGEDPSAVLANYRREGIEIGKLQISNGIVAPWELMANGRRREAIQQLANFAEDRYLHQTGRFFDGQFELVTDLPEALARIATRSVDREDPVGGDDRWVVHFHVPIFLDRFGHLTTTQDDIHLALESCLRHCQSDQFTGHIEIETYAWSVLPEAMRRRELIDDIVDEFRWLHRAIDSVMTHRS